MMPGVWIGARFAGAHIIDQLFASRNSVSKERFRQEMLRQFAQMDRNKDNVVSASEQQAKRRNH